VLNILLYKYTHAFRWYIGEVIYENAQNRKFKKHGIMNVWLQGRKFLFHINSEGIDD